MMHSKIKKAIIILTSSVALLFVIYVFFNFYFVFGEGVKAGQLNYIVYKGYIFKTYEGKLIQSGFKSQTVGTVQSYEFAFSVTKKSVADSLMRCSGREVELHYKEYLGVLPWRGVNKFVVDSVVSIK